MIQSSQEPIKIKANKTIYKYSLNHVQNLMQKIGFDFDTDKSKYIWFLRQILSTELPPNWRIESLASNKENNQENIEQNNIGNQISEFDCENNNNNNASGLSRKQMHSGKVKRNSDDYNFYYFNILNQQISYQHPMIPEYRRIFNRLLKLNKLREENFQEQKAQTILSREEQKQFKIRKWQEGKIKQENEIDMNLIGSKLRLKNLRQSDKEKIVGGSSRFKDVLLSMYDIKDKNKYENEKGENQYPLYDLKTKQHKKLKHLTKETQNLKFLDESLSVEQLQCIYKEHQEYYDRKLNKKIIQTLINESIMERVNLYEIIQNAVYYGINLLTESHLVWIGLLPSILQLPPGWIREVDYATNQEKFVKLLDPSQALTNHPADLYIYNLIDELRDYYTNNRQHFNDQIQLQSIDGLMRDYEANLTQATDIYKQYLESEKTMNKNRKRNQYVSEYYRQKNRRESVVNMQSNIENQIDQQANDENNMTLKDLIKQTTLMKKNTINNNNALGIISGQETLSKELQDYVKLNINEEELRELQRQEEMELLGLNENYVVTDFELFEVANQCELDIENDLNLLLALEDLIIDQHYLHQNDDWQFRVAAQQNISSLNPNPKDQQTPQQKCWWLESQLQKLKYQIKSNEQVSSLFTGPKGETIMIKVVEQRQKITEIIINNRLRQFGISQGRAVGRTFGSQRGSQFTSRRSSIQTFVDDSVDSQKSHDPYEIQNKDVAKFRAKINPLLPNQQSSNALPNILPHEFYDFSDFIQTYLQKQMSSHELKDLIFFCPFILYKDYLKNKFMMIKERNIDSKEYPDILDQDKSLRSMNSDDLMDSEKLNQKLEQLKVKRQSIINIDSTNLLNISKYSQNQKYKSDIRLNEDLESDQYLGLFKERKNALNSRKMSENQLNKFNRLDYENLSQPSGQKNRSFQNQSLKRKSSQNLLNHQPQKKQSFVNLHQLPRKNIAIPRRSSKRDTDIINVVDLEQQENLRNNEGAFQRTQWPPGTIPSNPLSSRASNQQQQSSLSQYQNEKGGIINGQKNYKQSLFAKDAEITDKEKLMNVRQLGDLKKKFSSMDQDISQRLSNIQLEIHKQESHKKPIQVNMPNQELESNNSNMRFEDASSRGSNLRSHKENMINSKIDNDIEKSQKILTLDLEKQQSIDSALNRLTNNLTPNYEHNLNTFDIVDYDTLKDQIQLKPQPLQLILNPSAANTLKFQSTKSQRLKEQHSTQKLKNQLITGYKSARDKHIVYQRTTNSNFASNNPDYMSNQFIHREDGVQYKVLKQIQGIDAQKYRDEVKSRVNQKFQEQKEERQQQMRLNFITKKGKVLSEESEITKLSKSQELKTVEEDLKLEIPQNREQNEKDKQDYQNLGEFIKAAPSPKNIVNLDSNIDGDLQDKHLLNLLNLKYIKSNNNLRQQQSDQDVVPKTTTELNEQNRMNKIRNLQESQKILFKLKRQDTLNQNLAEDSLERQKAIHHSTLQSDLNQDFQQDQLRTLKSGEQNLELIQMSDHEQSNNIQTFDSNHHNPIISSQLSRNSKSNTPIQRKFMTEELRQEKDKILNNNKEFRAIKIRQHNFQEEGQKVSGRQGGGQQVLTNQHSRKSSNLSSIFQIVQPTMQKILENYLDLKNDNEKQLAAKLMKNQALSNQNSKQNYELEKPIRTPLTIKFTNDRGLLFSAGSGRESLRSTNANTHRLSTANQAQRSDVFSYRNQCQKFFDNQSDLMTLKTQDKDNLISHQNYLSIQNPGNLQQFEHQWGFNTERVSFRPSTEVGQQRTRLINMKSSQSKRTNFMQFDTNQKPQTAVANSGRVKISNLLKFGGSSNEDKNTQGYQSNLSTNRKINHFNYYKEIFGDPTLSDVTLFKFQDPIQGIKPIHSKDHPDLLWIAQQALVIKPPQDSLPQSFYTGTFDIYQNLSTLNFGLHPGDKYFRELFENQLLSRDYSRLSEKQVVDCSWLYFKDNQLTLKSNEVGQKGYYFNMITQKQRFGEANKPHTLLKVSMKEFNEVGNNSFTQLKRLMSTGSLTSRVSLLKEKSSQQKLLKYSDLKQTETLSVPQTARNEKSSDFNSIYTDIKSRYLIDLKAKIKLQHEQNQLKSQANLPISKDKSFKILPSYFPLNKNDFLNQRKLSFEFTMKNKQEQQVKMKNEVIAQMLQYNHKNSENEQSNSQIKAKNIVQMPKQYVQKSFITPFHNQKQDQVPSLKIEEINLIEKKFSPKHHVKSYSSNLRQTVSLMKNMNNQDLTIKRQADYYNNLYDGYDDLDAGSCTPSPNNNNYLSKKNQIESSDFRIQPDQNDLININQNIERISPSLFNQLDQEALDSIKYQDIKTLNSQKFSKQNSGQILNKTQSKTVLQKRQSSHRNIIKQQSGLRLSEMSRKSKNSDFQCQTPNYPQEEEGGFQNQEQNQQQLIIDQLDEELLLEQQSDLN
eukprot:403358365